MTVRRSIVAGVLFTLFAIPVAADAPVQFNRDIRPILAEKCFYCHGQDANHRQADMRLDVRDAAIELGAIEPGAPEGSLLVERINETDPDLQMPPPDSNRHLSPEEKKLLERWIAEGAEYQTHWAFVAPVRPNLQDVRNLAWCRSPLDHFVLARLEAAGLAPAPEADRATLIKRLSIDLIGLPPTPEEVDAFVSDADEQAYERLVDRLLASPHYGERMALPWLDAARYADSNGFQQDGDTWQWIWRDWVVRALNDDLPFDQFTVWQLAGDLLPHATIDQKIASGFNRNHLLNGEGGAILEEQRFVNLFDRVDTTATNWLGLTMACAQCHDHKYDPITKRDYYGLLDAFNRLPETGGPHKFSTRIRVAPPLLELSQPEYVAHIAELEKQIAEIERAASAAGDAALAEWQARLLDTGSAGPEDQLPAPLAALLAVPAAERTGDQQQQLAAGLQKHFNERLRAGIASKVPGFQALPGLKQQLADSRSDGVPRVMIMSDAQPRPTHILDRGDYLSGREQVRFATPAFLPPMPAGAPANRLGLARWLMAPDHPLTARVQVNRMWQHFFGAGLVKTAEDFGVQSEFPVHGDLLDWLAVEFREGGWGMKRMHRLIVTSATYRQSSHVTPQLLEADRENHLYARASRFRMPALLLRDWALATAGLLDRRIGGRPVYPYQPEGVWEALAITKERDFTYPASAGRDLYRRSLYTFWRRTVSPANMFDTSNRQTCRVRAVPTSTPLHALTTLNDPTWVEAARVMAERAIQAHPSLDERLQAAFRRVTCRPASGTEAAALREAYEKQLAIFQDAPDSARQLLTVGQAPRDESLDAAEHAALASVCLAILNLDESLTRE